MAFTSTVTDVKEVRGGDIVETGTWAGTGGTASGTITANTSFGSVHIADIESSDFTSNTNTPTAVNKRKVSGISMQIAFTANDTGTYMFRGRPA